MKRYKKGMESTYADMRDTGSREGGSLIPGALFLSKFVTCKKWAHLDVTGTASDVGYMPTGFGVKTILALDENLAVNNAAQ